MVLLKKPTSAEQITYAHQHFKTLYMKNISQTEWRSFVANDENAAILDVRTPNECAEGIIENAIMINILEPQSFLQEIETLDKNKNYYIYCRSGARSAQACQVLDAKEFNNTYNLLGGIMEWDGETILPQ